VAEWQQGAYIITTDHERLDFALIHDYLSKSSYWARGRSLDLVRRSIENSLPFGVFRESEQVGFGRVVTDYATFAWIADVFVLEEHRGLGLSKWLIEVMVTHPQLQGFRRWLLATRDAHGLYRRYGFTELKDPSRWMEKFSEAGHDTSSGN